MSLLLQMALGIIPKDEDIEVELLSSCLELDGFDCNNECPVFAVNGNSIPSQDGTRDSCKCFCDGKKMLSFIRENCTGFTPEPKKKKAKSAVSSVDAARYARLKVWVQRTLKEEREEGTHMIFTCKKPLTPEQWVGIVDDYGINEVSDHLKALRKVIVALHGWSKPIHSANLTLRNWLNRELKVSSCEELDIPTKVVITQTAEEFLAEAQRLQNG